jgi:hypothetical protein
MSLSALGQLERTSRRRWPVALTWAAEAGRWDIVAQLVGELEARRFAQAGSRPA